MITAFVVSYGYLAIFVGTLLEGETILIAAGFAAHRGLLSLPMVVLVAIAGATLGDQLAFLLGRWKGEALIARFPALAKRKPQIHAFLERYDLLFILTVRFLYGLRIAGPVLLGSSQVPLLRFAVLNVIGATMWAMLISGAGYAFGLVISSLIADVERIEAIVLIVILSLGAAFWVWQRSRARMGKKATMKKRRV
ncbi:MAG: DedA family protein [Rugosibacter sp.]|nr:MAG: DedA family protein [Rugosibacter sp.]